MWLGKIGRVSSIVLLVLLTMTVPANAHGDMVGPDEFGPPLTIAVVLGVIAYWMVLLWPRREDKDKDEEDSGDSRRNSGMYSGPRASAGPQNSRSAKPARLVRVK